MEILFTCFNKIIVCITGMRDYTSLRSGVIICATLVNTETDTQTDSISSASWAGKTQIIYFCATSV